MNELRWALLTVGGTIFSVSSIFGDMKSMEEVTRTFYVVVIMLLAAIAARP